MSHDEDEDETGAETEAEQPKRGRGRPRTRPLDAVTTRRRLEAQRLEGERDDAAAAWEAERTVKAMAHLYATEQRLAAAWAAACRAEGKIERSLAFTGAAQRWAAAHAKALDQGLVDEVAELTARLARRERAERAAGS